MVKFDNTFIIQLLTAGSLVRVQLGEPNTHNPDTFSIFAIGGAFGFVLYMDKF